MTARPIVCRKRCRNSSVPVFLGRSTIQLTYGQISVTPFALCDFLTVDNDMARCFDADPHLRAIDGHHGDFHVVANSQSFARTACQDEHGSRVPSMSLAHLLTRFGDCL